MSRSVRIQLPSLKDRARHAAPDRLSFGFVRVHPSRLPSKRFDAPNPRQWLFATYLLGSGIVWSILILPLFPFVGRRGRYWLARLWCRAVVVMMRVITGVTCSVEGLEHLPDGPFIMLCRHESTWETLTFMALFPRRISFVFKRELERFRFSAGCWSDSTW